MSSLSARRALPALCTAFAALSLSAGAHAATCDRACIIGLTDRYVAALVKHDPSAVPLAPNVRFVENITPMKPGEGLWASTTAGPTSFKIYVPDVTLQQAGWMGVMQQGGKPVLVALRLKIEDGRITQAEHLVSAIGERSLANLETPRPGLVSEVPPAKRLSHDALGKIGLSYYDALDDNDGSKMPFAADCQRRENGVTTAGAGAGGPPIKEANQSPIASDCKGQMDSGSFIYIARIENRRLVAADPVTGLAMGFSQFRHPFDNLPYKVKHIDGSTSERNAQNMPYKPFDMPAAHIFKIGADGKVHEIEAVGIKAPYNAPSGWE